MARRRWPSTLAQSMITAGLEQVAFDEYHMSDELRPIGRPYSVAGILQAKTVSDEEKAKQQAQEEEFRNGVAIDTPFCMIVGRKPR